MAQRGMTAYALSQGAQLSYPSAYRLSRAQGGFGRLHADTLDRLCAFFEVQPGELLQWTPGNGRKSYFPVSSHIRMGSNTTQLVP
jgi:DNA-binding Xre family transcriptional regulator